MDCLPELNGDIVAEFLDDDDLGMDENGGVTRNCWKIYLKSLKGIAKNWQCLDLILLVMT